MTFRDRIHPQLRDWYDASAGFDFDHLETFVPKCNEAELANLKEDPQVVTYDRTIPCSSTTEGGSCSAPSTGRRPCASVM